MGISHHVQKSCIYVVSEASGWLLWATLHTPASFEGFLEPLPLSSSTALWGRQMETVLGCAMRDIQGSREDEREGKAGSR